MQCLMCNGGFHAQLLGKISHYFHIYACMMQIFKMIPEYFKILHRFQSLQDLIHFNNFKQNPCQNTFVQSDMPLHILLYGQIIKGVNQSIVYMFKLWQQDSETKVGLFLAITLTNQPLFFLCRVLLAPM